jgi:hypothetical protein
MESIFDFCRQGQRLKMFAEITLDFSAGVCYNGSSLNENGDLYYG